MFGAPISAGLLGGWAGANWLTLTLGLATGIGISFLNGWLIDRFLEPLISKFQKPLQKTRPRAILNMAAFAWAFSSSALSMFAPVVFFGIHRFD
jgi:hypothetical protein